MTTTPPVGIPGLGGAGPSARALTDREAAYLVGILAGEGHFGGDGRQPQVTLRMHTRHERLFAWLRDSLPGSALYGPYHHGGRSYYQWMSRGSHLRSVLAPLVAAHRDLLDDHVASRFSTMCERYGVVVPEAGPAPSPAAAASAGDARPITTSQRPASEPDGPGQPELTPEG